MQFCGTQSIIKRHCEVEHLNVGIYHANGSDLFCPLLITVPNSMKFAWHYDDIFCWRKDFMRFRRHSLLLSQGRQQLAIKFKICFSKNKLLLLKCGVSRVFMWFVQPPLQQNLWKSTRMLIKMKKRVFQGEMELICSLKFSSANVIFSEYWRSD